MAEDMTPHPPNAYRPTNISDSLRNVAADFFHNSTDLPLNSQPSQTPTAVQTFLSRQRRVFCDKELALVDNLFLSLKIGTHNINGLKVNPHKLTTLLEFIQTEHVDIFTLSDTNLSTYEGLFAMHQKFKNSHKIFWAGKDEAKIKGSGVAVIVNNKWARHYWEHIIHSPYLMQVKFLFKQFQVHVWIIYTAPSETGSLNQILEIITRTSDLDPHIQQLHVVTGDFNQIMDGQRDRIPANDSHHHNKFATLLDRNFVDAYRQIHPHSTDCTWSNGTTATRIDQIWISDLAKDMITNFETINTSGITDSDHNMIIATVYIGDLIPNNWSNTRIDQSDGISKEKRFCINWHEVNKEHWEKFAEGIANRCKERNLEMLIQELIDTHYSSSDREQASLQEGIDKIWMRILAIILNSSIDTLPHYWKLNADTRCQNLDRKKKKYEDRTHVHTAKLAYLGYLCNHPDKLALKDNERFRLNWILKITKYNKDYDDEDLKDGTSLMLDDHSFIISTDDFLSDAWRSSFSFALKERKLLDEKIYLNRKRSLLTNKIEAKFENIQLFQKAWLNSTLEKHRQNVSIDRAVIDSNENPATKCMVFHPTEVKAVAADTFAKQFRKRNTHLEQLNPFWRDIYKVQRHNHELFEPLCNPFDLEEWNETIQDLSKRSAAGPSGIDYNIIRKLPESFVLILLKFFNFVF